MIVTKEQSFRNGWKQLATLTPITNSDVKRVHLVEQ